jgi:hypothetical protein
MRQFVLIINLCSFAFLNSSYAQAPAIQWQKCVGGTLSDFSPCIRQTFDGGYVATGRAYSTDGDVIGNHDTSGLTSDVWVVKLDSLGNIQWQKCFGGSLDDYSSYIEQTNDSGYIVCATANSTDGDVIGNHGGSDVWILKLDSIGTIQWKKCYGGSWNEQGNYIQEINFDGYIIAAQSASNDGDVHVHYGLNGYKDDAWVIKLNGIGNIDWSKNFGGSDHDHALTAKLSYDGGYIVGCETFSNDSDVSGNHGMSDSWLVKLGAFGDFQWQHCFGGTNMEFGVRFLGLTSDFGYFLAGTTKSNNGDVSGNHGQNDYWIVKVDSTGNLIWQRCYGGSGTETISSLEMTNDGGCILGGFTYSIDGDVVGKHGTGSTTDYWSVKLDSTGTIEWQKCLGSDDVEAGGYIHQTYDNGYIISGSTDSPINNGDVTGNHSSEQDYWIVKLFPTPVGVKEISLSDRKISIYPNPALNEIKINSSGLLIMKTEIFNLFGKVVSQANYSDILDVSQISTGMYFAKVFTEKGTTLLKFIKE